MQGSDEWFQSRLGYATASCFSDVMAKGEGRTRAAYLKRVVAERLTGKRSEGFSSVHTDRGTEQEPYARMAYEAWSGNIVDEVDFIRHGELMAGCSPDGLVGDNGGLEIKCVLPTVQIDTIEKGQYPRSHSAQIQGSLWVTGRDWWDFVSYSPDLPSNLRLYVHRVERDEEYIPVLESDVRRFLDDADKLYETLLKRKCNG